MLQISVNVFLKNNLQKKFLIVFFKSVKISDDTTKAFHRRKPFQHVSLNSIGGVFRNELGSDGISDVERQLENPTRRLAGRN